MEHMKHMDNNDWCCEHIRKETDCVHKYQNSTRENDS